MTEKMIEVDVPGWKSLHLAVLALDVNGVLALDGRLLPVVGRRIGELRSMLEVHLLSADTHGQLDEIATALDVSSTRLKRGMGEAQQKSDFVKALGAKGVVAIGNGANDVAMLKAAELGIAVLGHEGLATAALTASDLVVGSVQEALDLLLRPTRVVATLRR